MALSSEKKGYNVLGIDVIPGYVQSLNDKTYDSPEPLVSQYLTESTNFRATTNLDEGLAFSDKIFILLATPTGAGDKSYDHGTLSRVLSQFNDRRIKNKHIIIGCTVLPGYIANVGRFLLRDCENVTLSYNPEFIAQGDVMHGLVNPDMVLIGEGSPEIGEWLENFYIDVCLNKPDIHRMSPESAEITKLSINCFITTKIAFANMIGDVANCTPGADGEQILRAVGADSRIGHKYLRPGYGFGGPCFPRDNRALGNYIKSKGIEPIIPSATDSANKLHAQIMAEELLQQNLDVYKFSDVCYKSRCPVPIIEESQKLEVAFLLVRKGKRVIISDRRDVIKNVQMEFGALFEYEVEEP